MIYSKIVIIAFIFLSALFPVFAYASQAGFADEPVWFSHDAPKEGDTVTIFALVVNGYPDAFTSKVQFYDRETLLGERTASLTANNALVVSLPWKVTAGEHVISAHIVNAQITDKQGKKVSIMPTVATSGNENIFVKKTVATEAAAGDSSGLDKEMVTDKVNNATEFIKENTPDSLQASFATATSSIEVKRDAWAEVLQAKKDAEKEKMEALDTYLEEKVAEQEEADPDTYTPSTYVQSEKGNILKKPMHYFLIFVYGVGHFIVSHALIFYGLALIIIFQILRALWRKFRK